LLVPGMALLLLDDYPAGTQRREQRYRLNELVLEHAPVELRRGKIKVGLCRMADIEHVLQWMTLVQAQNCGLGPPDHQCAKLPAQCPSCRPVIDHPLDTDPSVLQAP